MGGITAADRQAIPFDRISRRGQIGVRRADAVLPAHENAQGIE